jgi:hypothetical protein
MTETLASHLNHFDQLPTSSFLLIYNTTVSLSCSEPTQMSRKELVSSLTLFLPTACFTFPGNILQEHMLIKPHVMQQEISDVHNRESKAHHDAMRSEGQQQLFRHKAMLVEFLQANGWHVRSTMYSVQCACIQTSRTIICCFSCKAETLQSVLWQLIQET